MSTDRPPLLSRHDDPELDALQAQIDEIARARRSGTAPGATAHDVARHVGLAKRLRAERDQALHLLLCARNGVPIDLPVIRHASGAVICEQCGLAYRDHPGDMRCVALAADGRPVAWAVRLCDGTTGKL